MSNTITYTVKPEFGPEGGFRGENEFASYTLEVLSVAKSLLNDEDATVLTTKTAAGEIVAVQ